MKTIKKIGTITLSTLLLASLASILLYVIIHFFFPEKSTITTVNVDTLKNVERDDLKHILNIKYFKNADNSGKECFEMQLNYFMNEEISEDEANDKLVYSKGIQLVNSVTGFFESESGGIFGKQTHVLKPYIFPYYLYNMYQSSSYVKDSFISNKTTVAEAIQETDQIFKKDFFRITIDDDIYKMTFKNELDNEAFDEHGDGWLNLRTHKYYYEINAGKFIIDLYNAIKTLPAGENQVKVFEFLETFNYQKYDPETKQYTDILNKQNEDYALITQHLISYYAIKIDIYEEGITKATQSLFGCVNGQFNFNISGESIADDYFIGENKIKLNTLNFEYKVNETTSEHYPVLKESIKQELLKYPGQTLEIEIDMTYLSEFGIQTLAIDKEKLNLGDLKVYKFVKYWRNSSGEIFSTEVVNV